MLSEENQVSVVIATYNGEKYIKNQLESIVNQSYAPSEIVICDDSLNNLTIDIVTKFEKKHSEINWIIVKNSKPLGFRENFYKAINLAKCNHIFLSDQDDIWYENKISDMVEFLESEEKMKVLVSNFDFLICENGQPDKHASKKIKCYISRENQSIGKMKFSISNFLNKRPGWTFAFKKEVVPLVNELSRHKKELYHDEIIWYAGLFSDGLYHVNQSMGQWRRFESSVTKIDKNESKQQRFLRLLPIRLKRAREYISLAEKVEKNMLKLNLINKMKFYLYFKLRYYVLYILNFTLI